MVLVKVLLLILAIEFCTTYKVDDLCWIKTNKDITRITCGGKYWNQCGQDHCSVDKVSCKVFSKEISNSFSNFKKL
jgi:N6-adenosine-specific RNA methylase IME4